MMLLQEEPCTVIGRECAATDAQLEPSDLKNLVKAHSTL